MAEAAKKVAAPVKKAAAKVTPEFVEPTPKNDETNPAQPEVVVSDKTVKLEETGREVAVETLTNPALADHPEVEIAKRTSDRKAGEDTRFRKRYVVPKGDYKPEDQPIHERNQLEVLQTAIQQGLHPHGEASFDGTEDHPDGHSVYLDYSVEVVPAVIDDATHDATTPMRVLSERLDGSTEEVKPAEFAERDK